MERFKVLFMVGAIAGTIYFVKSIKISVSGAEAMVEESVEDEWVEDEDSDEIIEEETSSSRLQPREMAQEAMAIKDDAHAEMIRMIRAQQLCEFISFTQSEGISQKNQYKALAATLTGGTFKELEVFANADYDSFDDYKTVMAKTYILAKKLNAFESWDFKTGGDYKKGLSKEHSDLLVKIEQLQSMDPSNLLYSFFRNGIYLHYKNLDDDIKAQLFDKVMATSRYFNPVHHLVRQLYLQTKSNVVQFYLAQKIFEQPLSIENSMVSRTVWRVYDEGMREHVTSLLQKRLEGVNESSSTFGYEPGLYSAYRNILPFDVYEVTPKLENFESALTQPTYNLGELKLDLKKGCTSNKVNDLAIKLRAL